MWVSLDQDYNETLTKVHFLILEKKVSNIKIDFLVLQSVFLYKYKLKYLKNYFLKLFLI